MADGEGQDAPEALMSLPDVARYLGMRERTIYEWAQAGRLPAFKLGVTWRFRRSDIDAWLETQRSGPDVSSTRAPLVPPVAPPTTRWQERRARIEECRGEIEEAMLDTSRSVFSYDRFAEEYGADAVDEAVEELRRDGRRLVVDEERGRDGKKIKVIRRS